MICVVVSGDSDNCKHGMQPLQGTDLRCCFEDDWSEFFHAVSSFPKLRLLTITSRSLYNSKVANSFLENFRVSGLELDTVSTISTAEEDKMEGKRPFTI